MNDAPDTPQGTTRPTFTEELRQLINCHSRENRSHTPDWILVQFVEDTLWAFEKGVRSRELWYGRDPNSFSGAALEPITLTAIAPDAKSGEK